MKNLKLTIAIIAISVAFASCKDEKQEKAQKSLDDYAKYVDSVSSIARVEAAENWEMIENDYSELKMNVENSLAEANDKAKLQTNFDISTTKYEEFKNSTLAEKENMEANNIKTMRYKTLFGSNYVNDDMKFNWVNKDNILSVYDNFVNTVQKNRDSYSREDWDEIKLVYEALDTRKNTVEKEGLTSHDNNKIAGLKLKFAPMYTVNRMGAKSEENSEAKK
jgi:hypothetical protein